MAYCYTRNAVVGMSVCLSVCLFLKFVSHAKTAKPIEMSFGRLSRLDPRNHVLERVQIPRGEGAVLE